MEGLVGGRSTVDTKAMEGKAFFKKRADTLFVIQNEYCPRPNAGPRETKGGGRSHDRLLIKLRGEGLCNGGQIDSKGRATRGGRFRFDDDTMLTNNRHADTEAETRASAGTLGGVEGIENPGKGFGTNAHTVILKGDGDAGTECGEPDLHAAGIADFVDGIFSIGEQVEKNLHELIGVADDA